MLGLNQENVSIFHAFPAHIADHNRVRVIKSEGTRERQIIDALTIFGQGLRIGVVGLGFWCLMALAILAYLASLWVTEGSNGLEIVLEEDSEED